LNSLRLNGLSDLDELLRPRLASLDARCLYLAYGPATVAYCPFCNSEDPLSFFYYALPALLVPHLLHIFALGLATSSAIAGAEGNRWRTHAVIAGAVLAVGECYLFASYDWKHNARVTRPEDLDHFYWRMRTVRCVTISSLDACLAGLLWASSTNRIFAMPTPAAERMENAVKALEKVRGKMGAVAIVRNVVVRDETLRRRTEEYWKREGEVMGEVMDDREVVESVRAALGSGRVSVLQLEDEARKYAEGIVMGQGGPMEA